MADKAIGIIGILHRHTFPIKDTDLWGLSCALSHGIQDGYFKENIEWATDWQNKINELRKDLNE